MNNWTVWHRFNQIVKDNKVGPILCPDCSTPMVTRVKGTVDDEPHLWCYGCDTFLKPGLDLRDRVKAIVSEHYL